MIKRHSPLILILILLLLLTGCASYQVPEQPSIAGEMVVLSADQNIGQTFTPRFDGLEAVYVFMAPLEAGSGTLRMRLTKLSNPVETLAEVALPVNAINVPGFQRFDFTPLSRSTLEDYWLSLYIEGEGQVNIGTGDAASYQQGALYLNETPIEAQMAFQLDYRTPQLAAGLLQQGLRWLWWILLAGIAFILPGWALLTALWKKGPKLDFLSKTALAAGLSLSLYPILMLWTDWIGVKWGAGYLWIPVILSTAFLLWKSYPVVLGLIKNPKQFSKKIKSHLKQISLPQCAALFFVVALVIFIRFWHIRTLEFPLWGDAQQHTVIVQLFLDNGGLFDSWLPYAPYESYTTHFGFHANTAIFAWISGNSATQSVLLMGQILNALSVMALYPLAVKMTRGNHWSGAGTILAAGLLSQLPMYYTNWGRYAQLAGQTILPVAIYFLLEAFSREKPSLKQAVIISLLSGGMMLNYYRTPIFFLAFLPAILIAWARDLFPLRKKTWKKYLIWAAIIGAGLGLMSLPLILRLNQGVLITHVGESQQVTKRLQSVLTELNTWKTLTTLYPVWLLVLVAAGWILSLLTRRWLLASLALGTTLVQAYQFGRLINLPFAKYVQPFSVMIFLYIPAGLLIGLIAAEIHDRVPKFPGMMTAVLLSALAVFGTWQNKNLVNPGIYALITQADQRAFQWIQTNTPEDTLFLVESTLIYDGNSAVGSDAGWWLPLMTGRANTMPPQYALLNERPIEPEYSEWVVSIVHTLNNAPPASQEGLNHLCEWGITHIYIGQKQGQVGVGVTPLFTPEDFSSESAFTTVYEEDRVRIYAFDRHLCSEP